MNPGIWKEIFEKIMSEDHLHARWLATLSHLENCGARKISRFQPELNQSLALLQHAAEESRHAFYFRKQILRLGCDVNEMFELLGGHWGRRLLHHLDLTYCRMAQQELGLSGQKAHKCAYLLSTFAIETRAKDLYSAYERELRVHRSTVSIAVIVKEEELHLEQFKRDIEKAQIPKSMVREALKHEQRFFKKFEENVVQDIGLVDPAWVLEFKGEMKGSMQKHEPLLEALI